MQASMVQMPEIAGVLLTGESLSEISIEAYCEHLEGCVVLSRLDLGAAVVTLITKNSRQLALVETSGGRYAVLA